MRHLLTFYMNAMPPNKPLQLTPLRVEQDRGYFEGWFLLDSFPDLSVRRS